MADFIDFEAVQDDTKDVIMVSNDEEVVDEENQVCDNFIDDSGALNEDDAFFIEPQTCNKVATTYKT